MKLLLILILLTIGYGCCNKDMYGETKKEQKQ